MPDRPGLRVSQCDANGSRLSACIRCQRTAYRRLDIEVSLWRGGFGREQASLETHQIACQIDLTIGPQRNHTLIIGAGDICWRKTSHRDDAIECPLVAWRFFGRIAIRHPFHDHIAHFRAMDGPGCPQLWNRRRLGSTLYKKAEAKKYNSKETTYRHSFAISRPPIKRKCEDRLMARKFHGVPRLLTKASRCHVEVRPLIQSWKRWISILALASVTKSFG